MLWTHWAFPQKAEQTHPSPSTEDLLGRALIVTGRAAEGEAQLKSAWENAQTDPHIAFDYAQVLLHKERLHAGSRSD